MQYTERSIDYLDWITLFLLGCFVLLAIVKFLYPKRFEEFIELPINNKYFLVQGKSDEIQDPFNILLFVIQVVSVSLFIYLFFSEESKKNPWLFLQICTGYTVFVLVKSIIEKIIGNIFSIESIINGYLYQKLSYRNLLSLVVFIGNIVFFYLVKPNILTLLVFTAIIVLINIISLLYCYKNYRSLILSNFFYFILYLCALEISPYIVLYKALN